MSTQHVGWTAIRYRAPSEQPLSGAVLRRLPDQLQLNSVHLMIGASFDASDLLSR